MRKEQNPQIGEPRHHRRRVDMANFVLNDWYVAAWASEITGDAPFARTICNEAVVLFRDADGRIAAVEDRCSHRAVPLSCGKIVSGRIECGYHGLTFDGSGRCTRVPGQTAIPAQASIRSYPVVEKDTMIWIWMGEPDRADASDILDYPWHDDPAWPHMATMVPIRCNHMLVVDNLMDLSHVGFVHARTIGGDASRHVDAITTVDRTPTGVRLTRWMLDVPPPATYRNAVGFKGNIDRWMEMELVAPSNLVQWSGGTDTGTGAYDRNLRSGGMQIRIFHGITPETDGSCFYFWSTANGHRTDDPEATRQLHREIGATIQEDVEILELQERNLARYADRPLVDVKTDSARLQARRFIERRLAEERKRATMTA